MLQTQAVSAELLELLRFLMTRDEYKGLYLVGGTALALQLAHRLSVDIDLFGDMELEEATFIAPLYDRGSCVLLKKSKHILILNVQGIKVDFVHYPYRLLDDPMDWDGIRMLSRRDIGAMKLNAISGRGSRKDFIDLFFLLKEFSLRELLSFYQRKYPEGSEFLVVKSLHYFDDAEQEAMPVMLQPVLWETIKQTIREALLTMNTPQ